MAQWKLVTRHGSDVKRDTFDDLDAAITAMEERVKDIRRGGPLREVSAIRDYKPGQQVNARLELSAGGVLRRRVAGIDLMGDGSLVPYAGVVQKQPLEPRDGESPFDAVRESLT